MLEWVGADDLEKLKVQEKSRAFIDMECGTPFVKVPTELASVLLLSGNGQTASNSVIDMNILPIHWGLASVYKMATGKPSSNSLKDLVTGAVVYSYD